MCFLAISVVDIMLVSLIIKWICLIGIKTETNRNIQAKGSVACGAQPHLASPVPVARVGL